MTCPVVPRHCHHWLSAYRLTPYHLGHPISSRTSFQPINPRHFFSFHILAFLENLSCLGPFLFRPCCFRCFVVRRPGYFLVPKTLCRSCKLQTYCFHSPGGANLRKSRLPTWHYHITHTTITPIILLKKGAIKTLL